MKPNAGIKWNGQDRKSEQVSRACFMCGGALNQDESAYVRREVEKARTGHPYARVVKCPITPGCTEDVLRYGDHGEPPFVRFGIYCPQCGLNEVWKESGASYPIMSLTPLGGWNSNEPG